MTKSNWNADVFPTGWSGDDIIVNYLIQQAFKITRKDEPHIQVMVLVIFTNVEFKTEIKLLAQRYRGKLAGRGM